jgi:4-amino-4-deoxy-L-arabinose transferase-like glycosyltransferase
VRRLFPGDRRVWLVAGAIWAIGGATLLYFVVRSQEHLVGTNTAPPTLALTTMQNGQRLCQRNVPLPDGTGRVRLHVATQDTGAVMRVTMTAPGHRSTGTATAPATGLSDTLVPVAPEWKVTGGAVLGELCVQALGAPFVIHGQGQQYPGDGPLLLDGTTLPARLSLWFYPPAGQRTSILALAPKIMQRAALFRPSPIGSWTYWVLLVLLLPLAIYAAIRAVAAGGAGRRALVLVGAIAVTNAFIWALITPAFDAPDEQAHFAYVEHLARTGHSPARAGGALPFSIQEGNALNGEKTFAFHIYDIYAEHPPWTALDEQRWAAATHGGAGLPTNDGGGVTTASAHGPLYYGLIGVPAYWIASAGGTFAELTVVRLVSALLAGIIAICAALVVRELLPRWPALAVGAGLLVAFEPTFGFMSGVVNNDTGVNAVAAVTILLLVRALRRGLTWRRAIALGIAAIALPAAKGTGYELYPVIAVACVVLAFRWWRRDDRRRAPVPAVVLVLTGLVSYVAWKALADGVATGTPTALGGASPVQAGTHSLTLFLTYFWETFLPNLPFMSDVQTHGWPAFEVYIKQSWAVFGWTILAFPVWVYQLALSIMIPVSFLGAAALARYRRRIMPRLGEAVVVLLVPLAVVAGVAYVLATPTPRAQPFEQGRYIFPALVALAAMVAGACTVLGRRWAGVGMAALVSCTAVLSTASFALALSAWYS